MRPKFLMPLRHLPIWLPAMNPYAPPEMQSLPEEPFAYTLRWDSRGGNYLYLFSPDVGKSLPPDTLVEDINGVTHRTGDFRWESTDTRYGVTPFGVRLTQKLPFKKKKGYMLPLRLLNSPKPSPKTERYSTRRLAPKRV